MDDEVIYDVNLIEKLYKSFLNHPKDIHAHRITQFKYENGKFKAISGGLHYYKNSSFLNKLTGVGGVLYPPNCFFKDILNETLFMKLASTNDDQWFWVQGILNNVRIRVVENPNIKLKYIKNSQKIALSLKNDRGLKLFWRDFKNMISFYPNLKNILIKEYYSHVKLKENRN